MVIQWNWIKMKKKKVRARERERAGKQFYFSIAWIINKVSTVNNKATTLQERNEININLTISSPISGVILMLLLLILRASDVDAPSDL